MRDHIQFSASGFNPLCVKDPTPIAIPAYRILAELAASERDVVLAAARHRELPAGAILIEEGAANDEVGFVASGEIAVLRGSSGARQVRIATLRAGDCFGEMSVLNGGPASATLRAETPVSLGAVSLADLPPSIRPRVGLNLARVLVDRLATANGVIERKHAEQVGAIRLQLGSAVYAARMLFALSFYILLVPLSEFLKPYLPTDSLISFFFIAVFFGLAWTFVTRIGGGFDAYGMGVIGWARGVSRGLLLNTPLLVLALGAKLLFLRVSPESGHRLFEPLGVLSAVAGAGWGYWALFVIGYVVLSFAQEFIRCATQGSLEVYFKAGGVKDRWRSVVVSSVVFAAMHVHLSIWFAMLALVAGLFWGWMYQRERSYWGVAASHAVIGVWAVYLIGIPY